MGPCPYLAFINLMKNARFVLTDSGGIQEETTVLRTPCITVRENTERPITVESGTNRLVGTHPDAILAALDDLLHNKWPQGSIPALWDGRAAERIAHILIKWLR